MSRRVVFLLAACAVVLAVAFLTSGKDGSAASRAGHGAAEVRPVKAGAAAASPATSAHSGYDNFKLIHTRNVFDPDRRPARPGPATATPPPARTDYVALTGTFFDGDQKQLAFFSGTRPEYNKVLSVREQIAGATINKITGANVEVTRNGHPVTVAVGQTVPFDNSAPTAAPVPNATPAPPSGGSGASNPGGTTPGAPAAVPGAPDGSASAGATPAPAGTPSASKQDEIRRRMEERRRQEQK